MKTVTDALWATSSALAVGGAAVDVAMIVFAGAGLLGFLVFLDTYQWATHVPTPAEVAEQLLRDLERDP